MPNSQNTPIRFLYKQEITKRENYRPSLRVNSDQLSHIVGVFNFDQKDSFRCGLNGCGQEHWNGIIIATKTRLETHCGLDCGAREFPEDFKDKHALFRNALRRVESIQTVTKLKESSASHKEEALLIKRRIDSLYSDLQSIRNSLRRPTALNNHVESLFRSNGTITISVPLTEAEKEVSGGNQKFKPVIIGRVKGVFALRDFAKSSVAIESVINLLAKTQSLNPEKASNRIINQYINLNNNIRAELDSAQKFISSAEEFLNPKNLEELKKLSTLGGIKDYDFIRAEKELDRLIAKRNAPKQLD